jgi:hypothetical protein
MVSTDLRSGLNPNQLTLDSAYIGSKINHRQRISADSEIARVAGLELHLRRRRILAVHLAIALSGALSFFRLPPVLEQAGSDDGLQTRLSHAIAQQLLQLRRPGPTGHGRLP